MEGNGREMAGNRSIFEFSLGKKKKKKKKNPEATLEFSPESRLELGLNCNLGRREKLFSHYPKPVLFESNKLGLNRKVGCAVVVGSDWLV